MLYFFGPYRLDSNELTLFTGPRALPLGPKVILTLVALVERAGVAITKDELLARVWPEGFAEEASLSQNIYLLRKTLKDGFSSDPIATLPKRGYKFVAEVSTVGPPSAQKPSTAVWRAPSPWLWVSVALVLIVALVQYARLHASENGLGPQAQREYTLGRLLAEQRTQDGVKQSIVAFQAVISLAPTSPLGYSGLADSYLMSTQWCVGKSQCDNDARKAREFATQAQKRGPDAAETHSTLAFVAMALDNDPGAARREFDRAVASNPKYPAARLWYGRLLMYLKDYQAAAPQLEAAAALQPRSVFVLTSLAQDYIALHRRNDAVAVAKQALLIDRNDPTALGITR
jgi:DNA-binding winged helix-turn-helix (wHTH) protein